MDQRALESFARELTGVLHFLEKFSGLGGQGVNTPSICGSAFKSEYGKYRSYKLCKWLGLKLDFQVMFTLS